MIYGNKKTSSQLTSERPTTGKGKGEAQSTNLKNDSYQVRVNENERNEQFFKEADEDSEYDSVENKEEVEELPAASHSAAILSDAAAGALKSL